MKILIVEDNPTVRKLIRRVTADVAEEVLEREDGAEALDAYEEHQPDIVLMDLKMPRLDGLAATRQILSRFPLAKVIIVTDYNDEELRKAAHEAGACGYAWKHDLTELEAIVYMAYSS